MAIAESESSPRDSAIFFERAVGSSAFFISIIRASASRTAAYWLMVARIPVAAATPMVRYLAPSDAFSNAPKAATAKTPMSTSAGVT